MVTKKELQTISFYHDHAQEWSKKHGVGSKPSMWSAEFTQFQKLLPKGAILEVGVGGAKEAAEFINNGYAYTGIDPATALIEIAQKKFPTASFFNKSVYEVDTLNSTFDGFWCAAVLLHIPKENIDRALQKIKTVLKPNAVGFISLVQGEGEAFDEPTGRYFYLYSQKEFAHILQRNGFAIEQQAIRIHDTARPMHRTWLTYFVRNSK